MKPWVEAEGIEIPDKPKSTRRHKSGIKVYRYRPSLTKDAREIIGIRRWYLRENKMQEQGYHRGKTFNCYYCPVELYQVPELIAALQKIVGMVETPRSEEKKVAEDKDFRRFMR